MSEKKDYTYEIITSDKDKWKDVHGAVRLQDGTVILLEKNHNLTLAFPKDKFKDEFLHQINDDTKATIGVTFLPHELDAIWEGLKKILGKSKPE